MLALPERGKPDHVRTLGERHRHEAPLGIAPDLGDRQLRVGEVGDPQRDHALRVLLVPLLEEPVVPGPNARRAELALLGVEEHPAAEPGDLRGEVDRSPDAAEVHVAHPGADVVAPGTHLFEAERLELDRLGSTTGDGVHPDLGEALAFELPDLVALLGLDDVRRPRLQIAGQPALERVRRLDDVIVHRDERVLDLAGKRVGQEELRRSSAAHSHLLRG